MYSHNSRIVLLPNETLNAILSHFPTVELLPLALVSRRFYSLVAHILHQRLAHTGPRPENQLMLEFFDPTVKTPTTLLACEFRGTVVRDGPEFDCGSSSLADLHRLYASYRITLAEKKRGAPGPAEEEEDDVTIDVKLGKGECFSQLCAETNILKKGPEPGFFVGHVKLVSGAIRVFREWLAARAAQSGSENESDNILWIDPFNTVGIRFRVNPAASERTPLMSGPEDNRPVAYTLVYDELLVRASTLLPPTEELLVQDMFDNANNDVVHGIVMF